MTTQSNEPLTNRNSHPLRPPTLDRMAAFTESPSGGNPAGVWIGTEMPVASQMQAIAARVDYSETAFLTPREGRTAWTIRYFSPLAEVDFCGHATIAAGVVLGDRYGDTTYQLRTNVGDVPVEVRRVDGHRIATLTSVTPQRRDVDPDVLAGCMRALDWRADQLDPTLPPDLAFAGAWHLILAVATRTTLASLDYDFDQLQSIMADSDLTTVQIVWRESERIFHARNPFPVGGVVEDPATGAAAAALGGYLRRLDAAMVGSVEIHQGVDMGRPSVLHVDIPTDGGIRVSGTAVTIEPTSDAAILGTN